MAQVEALGLEMPARLGLVENEPLAAHTTFEVGGPARYFLHCGAAGQSEELLQWARRAEIPVLVLGGGSNVLISDRGFDGLVVLMSGGSIELASCGEQVRVRVDAGVEWDALVERVVHEGLGGLECLSGIPGRVGAAPIQNIGAYGQEVAETIDGVQVVERATGQKRRISANQCGFGYRSSHFKGKWRDRFVVTGVEFLLSRAAMGRVTYPDLRRHLGLTPDGPAPGPLAVRDGVLAVRRAKSMVIDAGDPNRRSAGSFFTNPFVTIETAAAIRRQSDRQLPAYPAADGSVKLSAAWLIEEAGFTRGYELGRAGLSSRHTLALINRGGATAQDLLSLAAKIRRQVREMFGVTLTPEPVFVGFDQPVEALMDQD